LATEVSTTRGGGASLVTAFGANALKPLLPPKYNVPSRPR
jgi:hypothetical protein